MKTKIVKTVALGLCATLALSLIPYKEVKARGPAELNLSKLLKATDAAVGNLYSDYETNWSNDGEDSEFIAYVVKNALEKGYEGENLVTTPDKMAENLGDLGISYTLPARAAAKIGPGDVISTDNAVYLSLGTCADGSVLLATTDIKGGVRLAGTVKMMKKSSEAMQLAEGYMAKYHPEWWKNLGGTQLCRASENKLRKGTIAVFHNYYSKDDEKLRAMDAEEVLHYLASGKEVPLGGNPDTNPGGETNPGGDSTNPGGNGGRKPGPSGPNTGERDSYLIVIALGCLIASAAMLRKKEY